jgi:hypothetical protein
MLTACLVALLWTLRSSFSAPPEPAAEVDSTNQTSDMLEGPVEGSGLLAEAMTFSVKVDGNTVGNVKAPEGATVKISEIASGKVLVTYGNAEPVWVEQAQLKHLRVAVPQMPTQNVAAPPVMSPTPVDASAVSRTASITLEGPQKEATVLIGAGKHRLRGQYSLSSGQKLVIAAGAHITAERNASISVWGGNLVIKGTPEAPVILGGAINAVGSWGGLKFNDATSVDIAHARISGADIGITLSGCQEVYLTSTSVTKCNTGILLQNRTKATIEDCLVANNKGCGIRDNFSESIISKTTISDNKEWGYLCEYYGAPHFDSCVIKGNKMGGIQGAIYDAYSEARNCIFDGNGKQDVVHKGTKDWNYSGCWWGEENTKRLLSGGENTNLRNIVDQFDDPNLARVRIEGFLKEKPPNVGSSVRLP